MVVVFCFPVVEAAALVLAGWQQAGIEAVAFEAPVCQGASFRHGRRVSPAEPITVDQQ